MPSSSPFIHKFRAMTVPCEVQLFGSQDASQIALMIEHNTRRLEQKYNFYSDQSWLSQQVNNRQGSSVELDDESLMVFEALRNIVDGTQGVFDPTVGTVKTLLASNASLGRDAIYLKAKPAMGVESWELSGKTLDIAHRDTRFDFGGVIKEFAIDQAINIADSFGVSAALINFGGDIRTLGTKPQSQSFNVAVLNPANPSEAYFSLPLVDAALTTSAHYERKIEFVDQTTSHILAHQGTHPKVLSVTVVAPTALEAGAISTALTIEPLLAVPEGAGVIFIDDQLQIHQDTEFLTR
ncbi:MULTISPECIES: FAD:protein FMN transferase [Vibrio]|uniref:FAD:protein FMN transferase n=1 Tax=Vibrio bivalvicida TaxID=1276888 RepID=A0A177XYI1_9VIBR|nr:MULTISPECIES: FAD:protein FMN transferase [Vibrio]KLN66721.1 thiamine biosynthesis protein ApbE [Vibrio sp. VPAP30]OAJ93416.1 thiamine biosynthesis protein ApbE [Vibrio bivalvicida]